MEPVSQSRTQRKGEKKGPLCYDPKGGTASSKALVEKERQVFLREAMR